MPKSCQQFIILLLRPNSYSKAIMAQLHIRAIAHHNAVVYQIIVDFLRICHLSQEEVSISGINLLMYRQHAESGNHAVALVDDCARPLLHLKGIVKPL